MTGCVTSEVMTGIAGAPYGMSLPGGPGGFGVPYLGGGRDYDTVVAGAMAVAMVIDVIAKYKANQEQRAAADRRARAAYAAAMNRSRSRAKAAAKAKARATQSVPASQSSSAARSIPSTDEVEKSAKAGVPKYLAVSVPPQENTQEKGGKGTYMLWDTQKQQLASDDVYVVKNDVRNGSTVKLNGVKAEVAGR